MNVAIVGGGLIGASWAALFATVGRHRVLAWDPSAPVREGFAAKVAAASEQLIALGAKDAGSVQVCDTLDEALHSADWVQENAPEKVAIKRELYGEIEAKVDRRAIIASSTSSFVWSDLASGLEHSDRLVIAHPFNPPHLIPLVELFCPDEIALTCAEDFFRACGRVPVRMKREAVGHIGNRLASALWREAVNIVAEGIADVGDVDQVLIHGPGLRWSILGTHLGYHLGGGDGGIAHYLRHLGPSQQQRWASLGNPQLTPAVCDQLTQGVLMEAAGRSIPELEAERDRQLMQILGLRQLGHPMVSANS